MSDQLLESSIDLRWTKETPYDTPAPTALDAARERDHTTLYGDIMPEPSLQFSRATWWDCLLSTYTASPGTSTCALPSRHCAASEISRDVYVFFKAACCWLSFLNVPLFFDTFCHTELRATIQPALVLSILAFAKMLQSNHDASRGQCAEERERAWRQSVMLRDLAQASFEASYNAGWIDLPLAQAAWVSTYLLVILLHRMSYSSG